MSDDRLPTDDGDGTRSSASIEPIEIQEEMERSFLDYAMSVITQRALPDARDGLKPVHRRILWGMYDLDARPDRAHMKCAARHRRRDGQVPPPRRERDLRRARADGSGLLAPAPAGRRTRQLRFARLRSGRVALHGVPARRRSRCACSTASTRTPSTTSTTTRASSRCRSSCRAGSRTCSSTAARASRSAWPPTSRRTTWARSSTPPSTCSTTPTPRPTT